MSWRSVLRPLVRAIEWSRVHRVLVAPLLLLLWRSRSRPMHPVRIAPLAWGRGISIVIPERGGGEMLARCLDSLAAARRHVDEPTEVIVIVNGSAREDYAAMAARHPDLIWQFHERPLGFTQAVIHGIALAKFGGVYLLNNDMILAPQALSALLPVRAPYVFGIASEIEFEGERRREETGWTRMRVEDGLPNPYHEPPEGPVLRGTVWAGAGSALFPRDLLAKLMPGSLVFDPFYWEDVDLGLRAWRMGYDSVVCPSSKVVHGHRVTVRRFYAEAEVQRVFERNRLQLLLRHPLEEVRRGALARRLLNLCPRSMLELILPSRLMAFWRIRRELRAAPGLDLDYAAMSTQVCRPLQARPCIVMVTPFAIYPARHGGAVRTMQLARSLAATFEIILLSDERELYSDCAALLDTHFASVHLISGRPDLPPALGSDRVPRMHSHAHRKLRSELRRLIETRRPVAVIVEHMELGALVDVPTIHKPVWLLSLQDVLLQPDDPREQAADRHELACMRRYDGLIVSSAEDQLLLGCLSSCLVANGIDISLSDDYVPSTGKRAILFVGPFRAPINFEGIVDFLKRVYPRLLSDVEGVSLTIVGGVGARARVANLECFAHPSIQLLEQVEDIPDLIRAHAVTINPQESLRGSSLKVIESLAVGRVCVSTRAGARGHLDASFDALLVADDEVEFARVLAEILLDDARRVQLERPQSDRLAPYDWSAQGRRLRDYLGHCIATTDAT